MRRSVYVQTYGWPLFREHRTFRVGRGRGVGRHLAGLPGASGGFASCSGKRAVKNIARVLVCLSLLLVESRIYAAENSYIVREGKGIENIGMLGDDIDGVEKVLGKADRIAKEDMYITDLFYEYHKQGLLITTDKFRKIKGITLYLNTGNKEQFHTSGLMWINPSSIYQTFQGTTSKGLKFKDAMGPEDVYAVYGKPEMTIPVSENVRAKLQEGKPLIVDMGKAGSTIYYPEIGILFSVFNGMVESCDISRIGDNQ